MGLSPIRAKKERNENMLKQTLIALGVLACACSAAAADITNPFYLPSQKQIGSITSTDYTRNQYKSKFWETETTYKTNLSEELQYGLTDNFTVFANIGNIFAKLKEAFWNTGTSSFDGETDTEDQNINWQGGFAWNILDQAFKLQTKLFYGQDPSVNRYNEGFGEYKYIGANIKAGYQFKTMLPYIEIGEQLPIGQEKGIDKPIYTAKVGLYQGKNEVWALDTGIRYTHDENTYTEGTAYTAEAEASYYLKKDVAVGLYGSYALKAEAKIDAKVHNKSFGARLRWFF